MEFTLGTLIGIVGGIIGIVFTINGYYQKKQAQRFAEIKEQTKADKDQDLEIASIKERIKSIEQDVSQLKAADYNLEEKLLKHMEKLETKIDLLNSKILEVLQQIIK